MKSHFPMFAAYNAWATAPLRAAAALSDADYRADRGAFFKSVHGTLNHLLVADRIWMRRFTGEGRRAEPARCHPVRGSLGAAPAAREAEDDRIVAYIAGLTDDRSCRTLPLRTITNPGDIEQPLAPALAHFFNHQTHHRGQAHGMLTGLGQKAPSLDLILFQRETGVGLG